MSSNVSASKILPKATNNLPRSSSAASSSSSSSTSSTSTLGKRALSSTPSAEQPNKKRKVEVVVSNTETTTYKQLTSAERVAKLKMISTLTKSVENSSEAEKFESYKLVTDLEMQIEKSDQMGLQKELDELKQKHTRLGQQFKKDSKTHAEQIENLNSEINSLKKVDESRQSKEQEVKKIHDELEKTKAELAKSHREVKQIKALLADATDVISQYSEEKHQRKESSQDIDAMKKRTQALEAQCQVHETEMSLLVKENGVLTDERNASQKALKDEIIKNKKLKELKKANKHLEIEHQRKTEALKTQYQEKFTGFQQTMSTQGANLNITADKILSLANLVSDLSKI